MIKRSNANTLLPDELLSEIQRYVQGTTLYIPKLKSNYIKWGETTQSKTATTERNDMIRSAFRNGSTIDELCEQHFLSLESVKRIVYVKM